jgi:hypothetical protein
VATDGVTTDGVTTDGVITDRQVTGSVEIDFDVERFAILIYEYD